ncbi:hypothetical protein EV193_11387 [Herbihabitans rhizosphaerae]|uniref:Uncharacterized protein n=1 Tax=Herbihabitans rhizosphaerae TaxID=1872711 RepID=A0A4Q7KED8_9PSEU|nr:hypothetical protein [Herbihabitans rhizosphaerae]RZS32243.1 hypothetical protein EV193_11387 [Herbihabitans rhizosphaerae]
MSILTDDTVRVSALPLGANTLLLYEDLSRARMRGAEEEARQRRHLRRLNSAKRWRRVSCWASRRAARAAEESA